MSEVIFRGKTATLCTTVQWCVMNKQTDTTDVVVQLVKPDVLVCTTALPVSGTSAQATALQALVVFMDTGCFFYHFSLIFVPKQTVFVCVESVNRVNGDV